MEVVNDTDKGIEAHTTNKTNSANSNERILTFYDHSYKRFHNIQYKRLAELIFKRYRLSKYELRFAPNYREPVNHSSIDKKRYGPAYRSIDEVMEDATKDDPACLIIDPVSVNVHPEDYSKLLDSLVEEKEKRGVVIWTHTNSFRGNIKMYRDLELPTVPKDGIKSTTLNLARVIKNELKRYEATQTT
jgi:hypothetical protein